MSKVSQGRYTKPYKSYSQKPMVPCRCKCPTCKIEWIEKRNDLNPNIRNYIYCDEHKSNRFKDAIGFERVEPRKIPSKVDDIDTREESEEDNEEIFDEAV